MINIKTFDIDNLKPLRQAFFLSDGINLAQDLIGKIIKRKLDQHIIYARIVETEAYMGPYDKGSHAYKNKRTKRTEAMFLEGGHSYIYLIYGMYYCLNIVANIKDKPEAVLIRAIEPLNNISILQYYRPIKSKQLKNLTNGPGKLCQALQIDKSLNAIDILSNDNFSIWDDSYDANILKSPRRNIDYAEEYRDKLWRFYLSNNKFVS